jgi:hypothetical protein
MNAKSILGDIRIITFFAFVVALATFAGEEGFP